MKPLTRVWPELGYGAEAQLHSHYAEFVVYAIDATTLEGEPLWHKAGSPGYPDPVATFAEAEPYLSGIVKWDGCSNWDFHENKRCSLHGCSRDDLLNIGGVMAACWDWAAEALPSWDVA